MVETLTYDALSSNKLSAMVDSEYVFWGSILRDHRSGDTRLAAKQLVEELFELGRVGIQLVENAFFAMLGLVLRLPSAKSFRQVMPVFEEPRVQHLQNSADVAGALAIEIKSSGGRVGVFRAGAVSRALQKLHRHKRIEKIRDAAGCTANSWPICAPVRGR
jgi:hypothetical protein